ncbi:nucleoside transporter-domain-containing protein [Auriculariales sp. MPI-PUGE-AT-0066]|nr:nucleoside transporter-domain-containing protein [Auriculariales sp. MPI-PUGE-AT-0066]
MLGAATLLPWNAMITTSGYFSSRLAAASSPYAARFSYTLSTTLTVSNLVFLLHATLSSKRSPITRRLRFSGLLITALFTMLALATSLSDIPASAFFWSVLLIGAVQIGAASYMSTAAALAGQAAAGVVVSVVQLLTKYSALRAPSGSDPDDASASANAAFWFFAFSTAFMLLSLLGHAYVARQRTFRHVLEPFESSQTAVTESFGAAAGMSKAELVHIGRVTRANGIYYLTVAFVFGTTLSVYPAITGSVAPHSPTTNADLSNPALFTAAHFLIFNASDWLGRFFCSIPQFVIHNPHIILALAAGRLLFIPIFLSCNVVGSTGARGGAPNALFFFAVSTLGITGGWLGSLCVMGAVDPVHNRRLKAREDVDTAATVAGFAIVVGLMLGSFASMGISSFIN